MVERQHEFDICYVNMHKWFTHKVAGNEACKHGDLAKLEQISYCCIQVPQEEYARIREGVPCVKVHRYNPKQLCTKLNGYGDNGQRSLKF